MSDVPSELRYTASHEWIRDEGDGTVTIGITDHAQELLGDLVFVELPEVGADLTAGDACCVVESVKAASDVYAPLTGEVLEVNEMLAESPEIINDSAFDDGWLFKMQLSAEVELEELMDADEYEKEIED
ncbi:MAG: glycine cleavage system protein GcvH [Gammaproteobacteria bacterium]|nr:glycine cleavage system protein GcvH [Gammaproteobacteria bacterium]